MIGKRTVVCLIPARAGSEGLPGKNVREMCGKPLIAWSIEKAGRSRYADVVAVSTDSPAIAEVSRKYGAVVPFLRPAELATATASTYDVIRHALRFYREAEGREFDYTVLLEPTSPLREDDDIDRMLELLDQSADQFDSIVSVGEIKENPAIVKRLHAGRIEPYCPDLPQTTRRQDDAPAFFPYGVAYIAKTDALLDQNTFYTRRCAAFPIKRYQRYEIDDLYDFLCVGAIMRHTWGLA